MKSNVERYGENYRGKSSSEIKEAKGKRLTSADIQAGIDDWLEDFNNEVEHYNYGLRSDL